MTGTGGVVPVPEALTEPLPPLLAMLMVALLAPVLPGLNARVNAWLPPAAILNGVAGAVTAKSVALLLEMVLIVNAALPVLDMVTVWDAEVVPTFWLLKVRVAGDTPNTGAATVQAGSAAS